MFHTCPRGKTVLFVRGPICLDLNDISNFPPAYTKNTANEAKYYFFLLITYYSALPSTNYRFTIIVLVLVRTRCPLRVTAQQ